MIDALQKVETWIKMGLEILKDPILMFTIAIACLALSLMPSEMRASAGIGFIEPIRGWIFLTGFVSGFISLVTIPAKAFARILKLKRDEKSKISSIQGLSPVEKQILWTFLNSKSKSMHFPPNDAAIKGLLGIGMVARPGGIETHYAIGYVMEPWVWKIITEHPDVLEGKSKGVYENAYASAEWL